MADPRDEGFFLPGGTATLKEIDEVVTTDPLARVREDLAKYVVMNLTIGEGRDEIKDQLADMYLVFGEEDAKGASRVFADMANLFGGMSKNCALLSTMATRGQVAVKRKHYETFKSAIDAMVKSGKKAADQAEKHLDDTKDLELPKM
jgi:hypothetical protein